AAGPSRRLHLPRQWRLHRAPFRYLRLQRRDYPGRRQLLGPDRRIRPAGLVMMRAAALALAFGLIATPLAAAPFCHVPQGGGRGIHIQLGVGKMSETDKARFYELQLRRMGIDARDTVLWNECI